MVVKELSAIRDQLQLQLSSLSKKEAELKKRESAVICKEEQILKQMESLEEKQSCIKKRESALLEVEECVSACQLSIEKCIEEEIQKSLKSNRSIARKLEEDYYRAKKDNNRLKAGLASICSINEKLKEQLKAEKLRCSSMEQKVSALQGRLVCLRVKHAPRCKQQPPQQPPAQPEVSKSSPNGVKKDLHTENQSKVFQLLVLTNLCMQKYDLQANEQQELLVHHLMQWATEVLATINCDSKKTLSSDVLCSTTFSLLGNCFSSIPVEHHHTCLRFICRAILHINPKTKSLLSSSLRRIGELCAASAIGTQSHGVKLPPHSLCNSLDIRVRLLSCLVILQTLTQVDAVNLAMQALKCDLRQTNVQGEFISFGGVQALFMFLTPAPKLYVLCGGALDIFILLSSDSGLKQLLNDKWFGAAATLIQDDNFPTLQLEKLSILLQRLSSTRHSRTLFNKYAIAPKLNSLMASKNPLTLTSFIHLNISSTLTNLTDEL